MHPIPCRFLLCYCTYTNAQRQGAALNMTVAEAKNAKDFIRGFDKFKTISVHVAAKNCCPVWISESDTPILGIRVAGEVCGHLPTINSERRPHLCLFIHGRKDVKGCGSVGAAYCSLWEESRLNKH